MTKVYPGGYDLLEWLRTRGLNLGLCTNKPRLAADPVLKKLELNDYFDIICCGDDVEFQKPDGRHIMHILKAIDVRPSQCLLIGDSLHDLAAARDAGVSPIMVSYGYDRDLSSHPNVDLTATSLHDVRSVLEELLI